MLPKEEFDREEAEALQAIEIAVRAENTFFVSPDGFAYRPYGKNKWWSHDGSVLECDLRTLLRDYVFPEGDWERFVELFYPDELVKEIVRTDANSFCWALPEN